MGQVDAEVDLFERLDAKPRPSLPYPVRVEDTTTAQQAVADAQGELLLSLGSEHEEAARQRLADAGAALKACFQVIKITAMDPELFEDLVDDHPPREDTDEKKWDDEAWNADTFPRALFYECVPPGRDEAWWAAWLKRTCSDGEQTDLFNAAVAVNVRSVSPTLPKGWTEILS